MFFSVKYLTLKESTFEQSYFVVYRFESLHTGASEALAFMYYIYIYIKFGNLKDTLFVSC